MTDEPDMMAAELALGVLDPVERAEALRRRMSDPVFAAEVEKWCMLLGPMCDIAREHAAPNVWASIERRIRWHDESGGAQAAALPANDMGALRRWRWGAIGSGAVAAVLALMLVTRPSFPPNPVVAPAAPSIPAPQAPVVIAQLSGDASGPLLSARFEPALNELAINAHDLPNGKLSPELWVIPEGGAPLSLGLIARSGVSEVKLSSEQRKQIHDGATLAITLEPTEGAPHEAPSSTPVAVGKISTI